MFDQDEQDFSQIVETGLELILSGKATLEQVLARFPDRAQVLRPELEAALWLSSRSQEVMPRPGFVSASRRRVMDRIKQESVNQSTQRAFTGVAWPKRLSFQWVLAAVILFVLFSGTGGMVTYAQSSIPGDDLYSVKRVSESVAYTVSFTDVRRVQLGARFAEQRLNEAAKLIEQGDYEAVAPVFVEYKQQMNRAIALAQSISVVNSTQAAELADELKQKIVQQAGLIEAMGAGAPASVVELLSDAQSNLEACALAVDDLADGVFDLATATPTSIDTATFEPTVVPSPLPSDTPVPAVVTDTPLPTDPMYDEYPAFDEGLSIPTAEPSSEDVGLPTTDEKVTKTPKPDNPNKYIVPGLTDNPSETKPEKPEKPKKDK